MRNTCRVQAEAFDAGLAAGRHQQVRARKRRCHAVLLERDGDGVAVACYPADGDALVDLDTVRGKLAAGEGDNLRIIAAEHPVHLQQRDTRAEPALGLCQLGARSEEHTSELQSLMRISYAVFRLKKK